MKFLKISLISSTFALFIFSCAQTTSTNTNTSNTNAKTTNIAAQPTATADELASVEKIYTEKCVKCHKADGTGGNSDLDGIKIKAPNLTSDRMKGKSDASFIDTIENGAKEDGMPAFKGVISDAEIKNLVKYIRREFQGNLKSL